MEQAGEAALVLRLVESLLPPVERALITARYTVPHDVSLLEHKTRSVHIVAMYMERRYGTGIGFVEDVVRRWSRMDPVMDNEAWARTLGRSVSTIQRRRRTIVSALGEIHTHALMLLEPEMQRKYLLAS